LALNVLLGWHIYLILHNKTTIEVCKQFEKACFLWNDISGNSLPCIDVLLQYHEGVRAMWLAEKVGNIYRHPYALGVYENLVSVRFYIFQ